MSTDEVTLQTGARVRLLPAQGSTRRPAVIIAPGWGSDILGSTTYAELARALNNIGYHVCLLAPRGYPGAEGSIDEVTRHEHLFDARYAYHWLAHKTDLVDRERICGFGASHGGYLMATLAGEKPMTLLALRAPAIYPDLEACIDWAKPDLPMVRLLAQEERLNRWWSAVHAKEDSMALAGIASFTGKLLCIVSGADELIPPQVALSYGEAATRASCIDCEIIPNAPHALQGEHRERFLAICAAWFDRNLSNNPS